jgi:hypothetical protein
VPVFGDLGGNMISQGINFVNGLGNMSPKGLVGTGLSLIAGGFLQGIPGGKGVAANGIYGAAQDAFFNSITGSGSELTLLNLSGSEAASTVALGLAAPIGLGKSIGDVLVFAGAYFYSCSDIQ